MSGIKEVKTIQWKSRLSGSFKSIGFGFLMLISAVVLLWINEGRAVKTYRGLKEGQTKVIEINPNQIDSKNNNQLIHFSEQVITSDTLVDDIFNIIVNALKLKRLVEVYQWKEIEKNETTKNVGGSQTETTTYTYQADWFNDLIDSKTFNDTSKNNPTQKIIDDKKMMANDIKIGEFILSDSYIEDISNYTTFTLSKINVDTSLFKHPTVLDNYIYLSSGTVSQPQVGDVRISFQQVETNQVYSVLAMQSNQTLKPFETSEKTTINVFSQGKIPANKMIEAEQSKNTFLTWMLRVVGIALMFFGFKQIMEIFVVLGDVLPILGTILNYGTSIIGGVLALLLSFLVISVAWFAYRPVLLLTFLGVTAVSLGVSYYFVFKKRF